MTWTNLLLRSLTFSFLFVVSACSFSESERDDIPDSLIRSDAYRAGWVTIDTYGQGQDVILIPGLASSADVWHATVANLSPDYQLHVVQVAGFAGSPASTVERQNIIEGLSNDIATYIASNNIRDPIIVGHSLGGLTVLRLAVDHPNIFSKGVVIDALPFISVLQNPNATSVSSKAMVNRLGGYLNGLPEEDYIDTQRENIKILVKRPQKQRKLLHWFNKSDRQIVMTALQEIMTTDIRPELTKVRTPISVIFATDPMMGRSSKAIESLYRTQYANIHAAEFYAIDDSFHFVMFDQPRKFQNVLRKALKRNAPK